MTPNPNQIQLTELKQLFQYINNNFLKHKFMIWGDFNLNLLNTDSNIIKQFKALLNKYGLSQMVKTYTYPSSPYFCIRKSLLDLFIVNDKKIIKSIEMRENISPKCDYLSLLIVIEIPKEKLKSETKLWLDQFIQ